MGVFVCLTVVLSSCGTLKNTSSYDRTQLAEKLESGEAGLVLGEFPLKHHGVVDGDTVKVGGLDSSLRLLGMDTEETFKNEPDKRSYETGFYKYLAKKAEKTNRPVKVATPLGEEAKKWAKHWFEGVQMVRLERDDPRQIKGAYGRYLAYVFAKKNGQWVNYNIEAMRAGMSPYFTKYGFSLRFHDDFVQAQEEARQAKLGIWDPKKEHYHDYEKRLAWWNARGEFVQQFVRDAEGRDDYIALNDWDAMRRLREKLGKEVTVLSTVGKIKKDKTPAKVNLSRRMFESVPVIFFDPYVLEDSKIEQARGEYVRVRGRVNEWENPYNGRKVLQLIVTVPSQVTVPTYTPPDSDYEYLAELAGMKVKDALQAVEGKQPAEDEGVQGSAARDDGVPAPSDGVPAADPAAADPAAAKPAAAAADPTDREADEGATPDGGSDEGAVEEDEGAEGATGE